MLCIGTYFTNNGMVLLYKLDYKAHSWVTNICYKTSTGEFYSPNMLNLVLNARDHDGRQRDSIYWNGFVSDAHDSFVSKPLY